MKLRNAVFGALLLGSSLFAGEIKYASEVKSLFASEDGSKTIGRLLPTTEVEVLKESKGKVLLKIKGWSDTGSASVLYAVPGHRILNAAFTRGVEVPSKVLDSKKVGDKEYKYYEVEVYAENKALVKDVKPLYEEAKALYTENCSMCHSLHKTTEFKANQWPSVIKSMLSRTAIPKDKSFLVIQYVQKNAGDVKDVK